MPCLVSHENILQYPIDTVLPELDYNHSIDPPSILWLFQFCTFDMYQRRPDQGWRVKLVFKSQLWSEGYNSLQRENSGWKRPLGTTQLRAVSLLPSQDPKGSQTLLSSATNCRSATLNLWSSSDFRIFGASGHLFKLITTMGGPACLQVFHDISCIFHVTKGSVSYLSSPCFSTIIGGIGGPARGKPRILDVMY